MEKNDLWEAQCFFRHLSEIKTHNETINRLSTEQKEFFEKISFYYGMVPHDVQNVCERITKQIQKLIVRLIPLYQIGIRYDIYLAGGSIRDLVYGNHNSIKDLDIVFSINENSLASALKTTPIITLEAILGKDVNKHIDWRNDSQVKKLHSMFLYCLSKDYEVSRGFTIEDIQAKGEENQYENLLNQNLEGIIAIKDAEDDYPMDILLTTSPIDTYLNSFNFEICKTYVPVFRKKDAKFITNPLHILEYIHVAPGFISDGMNKTITLKMASQKSLEAIEKSVNTHLPRIMAKYPDYKLVLNPGPKEEYVLWKNKFESYIQLNKSLPTKVNIDSETPKVMKI